MGLIFEDDNRLDLSRFDDEYTKIALESDGWDSVPDGYYQTRVEDVRLSTTQTTGNPMVIWRLRITGPTQAGSTLTKTRIITSKTLGQVKRDLAFFGVNLDRFSALPDHLEEMVDKEAAMASLMTARRCRSNGRLKRHPNLGCYWPPRPNRPLLSC